jgi:hypothetical protein
MAAMTPDEFWSILHAVPETQPLTYRLYYDSTGALLFYSMDNVPGNYIEIDAVTFARSPMHVCVRDEKLIQRVWKTTTKLVPADSGSPCDLRNVAVIVGEHKPHQKWTKKTYETN